MRFTVAIPPQHRTSLEDRLPPPLLKSVEWQDLAPADVVIGLPGLGRLAYCSLWPGEDGALALIAAGYERLLDQKTMERLHDVGRALVSEQNLDKLLDLILSSARKMLSAEGGSLYLVVGPPENRELLFAHTQNAIVSLPYHRFKMPISTQSMAGFVAYTGQTLKIDDLYQIPAMAPYHFNDSFDRQARYRSISMLAVPLKDTEGQILGVLQLINRVDEDQPGSPVVPFQEEHQVLAESLAGQAGVAVKNAHLRQEIEHLFESFVNASVLAIEQRDPVTSGHSGRVAELTVGLAEAVNATHDGPFGSVTFNDRQLRELRYASLLHDFGKVGVREQVLVKSKKLDSLKLEIILQRIRQRQEELALAKLKKDYEDGVVFDPDAWQGFMEERQAETRHLLDVILRSNEPTLLSQDIADELSHLTELRYTHWNGQEDSIVDAADLDCLKIKRGSLSDEERMEIESHVTLTFNFLKQIPWTRDLAGVPDIAFAHHERVNGTGYPRKLPLQELPIQSRAMAVADVFDALTAQDRPYKAAVPLERSLKILEEDAKAGNLDADLLKVFIEAKVFERTVKPKG